MTSRAGRSASAPPPQPCPSTTDTVGTVIVVSVAMHRAISPAIARSSACADSSAPGVSMTVTSGRPSSSARRIARRASRSAPGPIGVVGDCRRAVLPDEDARLAVEPGQRDEHGRRPARPRRCRCSRSVPVRAVPQQVAHAGPVGSAGDARSTPRRTGAGSARPRGDRQARHGRAGRRARASARSTSIGRSSAATTASMHALGGEVLGRLHARRERLAVERLVDLRARGSRRARRARPPSRARASPTTRTRRRWSGGAGARGRAAPRPGAP